MKRDASTVPKTSSIIIAECSQYFQNLTNRKQNWIAKTCLL